jgi:hypothetical protein
MEIKSTDQIMSWVFPNPEILNISQGGNKEIRFKI